MTKLFAAAGIAALAIPAIVLAVPGDLNNPIWRSWNDVENTLFTVIEWMFVLVVILSVIFILYGAFLYATAGGDSARVTKANQTLVYATIGLAAGILAWSIVAVIHFLITGEDLPS
jgi:hypothetical protein